MGLSQSPETAPSIGMSLVALTPCHRRAHTAPRRKYLMIGKLMCPPIPTCKEGPVHSFWSLDNLFFSECDAWSCFRRGDFPSETTAYLDRPHSVTSPVPPCAPLLYPGNQGAWGRTREGSPTSSNPPLTAAPSIISRPCSSSH